jgi:glycosyltransferase involved in cell wall biosynthesis
VRALIVTNMYPTATRPALGSFVRDQVRALERIPEIELELFAFAPGSLRGYAGAARALRRRFAGRTFDIVHAHFGLTGWPALAVDARAHVLTLHGTDVHHPRSRAITLAAARRQQLVAAVSAELAALVPRWAVRQPVAVLPCGVDQERFRPVPRADARAALGLDPDAPCLLFPADPGRPEKRFDLARTLAGDVKLLVLDGVDPERVPLLVNAANAVIAPSDREGFGLAVLEALSCDVPVLATPHGIAPEVLDGVAGTYCGAFEPAAWSAALAPHLATADPRVAGRDRAEPYSADRMAARVLDAWRSLLAP